MSRHNIFRSSGPGVLLAAIACFVASPGLAGTPLDNLAFQKISDLEGGFSGLLLDGDSFGRSVASVGDLDQDGVPELAVGARFDDDGGPDRGAVWILFMNADGTVSRHQKISDLQGNFTGGLQDYDRFGASVDGLGDLDGDGIGDLAVGAVVADDGLTNAGAVWILYLTRDGTVRNFARISAVYGGLVGPLSTNDHWGRVAALGDINGDGFRDLAVGAGGDDDGGVNNGAVWVLFLDPSGQVLGEQKFSETAGGFPGQLDNVDLFGVDVTSLGDLNGDGFEDIAVGARRDDDGFMDAGAVWILFLNDLPWVQGVQKISALDGNFTGPLAGGSQFGSGVASVGDVDGDGNVDLAVGAKGHLGPGAVFLLFLNPDGTVRNHVEFSSSSGPLSGALDSGDEFGVSVAPLRGLRGSGGFGLAIGCQGDDDGGMERGAAWIVQPRQCDRRGNVNARVGVSTDVLFLNGAAGDDPDRRVEYNVLEPFELRMARPPAVPSSETAPFAVYVWRGRPQSTAGHVLPFGIGCSVLPMPITGGQPRPDVVWNNAGRNRHLGAPILPSSPAPSIFFRRPGGLRRATAFFIQGLIFDPGAQALVPASLTNGIQAIPTF